MGGQRPAVAEGSVGFVPCLKRKSCRDEAAHAPAVSQMDIGRARGRRAVRRLYAGGVLSGPQACPLAGPGLGADQSRQVAGHRRGAVQSVPLHPGHRRPRLAGIRAADGGGRPSARALRAAVAAARRLSFRRGPDRALLRPCGGPPRPDAEPRRTAVAQAVEGAEPDRPDRHPGRRSRQGRLRRPEPGAEAGKDPRPDQFHPEGLPDQPGQGRRVHLQRPQRARREPGLDGRPIDGPDRLRATRSRTSWARTCRSR